MKLRLLFCSALFLTTASAHAAVTAAERLLPADTAAIISVPDWSKTAAAWNDFPMTQLWRDPAMRKFVEKFNTRFQAEVATPLERELGIKFSDYAPLFQGQLTYAITGYPRGRQGSRDQSWLLLIDSRDKGELVASNLADLRKKWVDAGKPIKTDRIRDMDVVTLVISSDDLMRPIEKALPGFKNQKAVADPDAAKAVGKKYELTVGQLGSLLLVGNNPKDFEKILIGHSGGLLPVLADRPEFERVYSSHLRGSLAFAWANVQVINDLIGQEAADGPRPTNPLAPKPDKVAQALGLGALNSISASITQDREGGLATIYLDAPEATRKGLLKILSMDPKESAPPAFVPADVVKFSRWRQDGQRAWAAIETILNEFSPAMAGVVKFVMEAAGKDRDPKFDLRKQLIGNLGNDFVRFEKPPRSGRLEDINSPPTLNLIASPNPEILAQAFKTGSALLSSEPPTERDFLGRKIYSLKMLPMTGFERGKPAAMNLHFAASGAYIATATDAASLEEYLRTGDTAGKSLRELAGLLDAAQKVGGTDNGWFAYENQTETLRASFEAMKRDPTALDALLSFNPIPTVGAQNLERGFREWFDPTLLPPFETISKYFHFTVFGAKTSADGITFKTFAPLPPALRN